MNLIIPHQEFLQINTHNILFIVGGAFEGMQDIVSKRVQSNFQSIGFQSDKSDKKDKIEHFATNEDLLEFGFIPEFIGRLPMIATLDDLDEKSLVKILQEPKNSLTKQYAKLFEMEDVEIQFREDALKAISEKAQERKTGARGLRSIMEAVLLDTMFKIPSLEKVSKVIIDSAVIEGMSEPLLMYENIEQKEQSAVDE